MLTDLIHPHCWTLLQVTSGLKDFWEHFSYNWGCSKIILWQVKMELSSVQDQLSIRAEELFPLALFPLRSLSIAKEGFQG